MTSITSSLMRILQISPVAWYKDDQGRTAYLESPVSSDIPGKLFINGKLLGRIIIPKIDLAQPDLTTKSIWEELRTALAFSGIPLEQGWTCHKATSGMELQEACQHSPHFAARNEDGTTAMQYLDTTHLACFIDGKRFWTIDLAAPKALERVLNECGVVSWIGWIPSRVDLLALYEGKPQAQKTIKQR